MRTTDRSVSDSVYVLQVNRRHSSILLAILADILKIQDAVDHISRAGLAE